MPPTGQRVDEKPQSIPAARAREERWMTSGVYATGLSSRLAPLLRVPLEPGELAA